MFTKLSNSLICVQNRNFNFWFGAITSGFQRELYLRHSLASYVLKNWLYILLCTIIVVRSVVTFSFSFHMKCTNKKKKMPSKSDFDFYYRSVSNYTSSNIWTAKLKPNFPLKSMLAWHYLIGLVNFKRKKNKNKNKKAYWLWQFHILLYLVIKYCNVVHSSYLMRFYSRTLTCKTNELTDIDILD